MREAVDMTTNDPPGLWSNFRERTLEVRGMGRPLRLVVAVAVAQLLAAALLLALRNVPYRITPLVAGQAGLTGVPVPVLWATVLFMVLAWAYVLAGALHGHPVVGIVGLAAFGLALIPIGQDIGWHGAPGVLRVAALAGIAGVALASWRRRRSAEPGSRTLSMVRLVLLVGLVGAVYVSFAWDASERAVFRFFTYGLADQLMSISFFLIPLLFLTGAGFSDWARLIGDRVVHVSDRVAPVRLPAVLAAAISVAVLVNVLGSHPGQIPSEVVLFAVAAGLVPWRARLARPAQGWPRAVPPAVMVVLACAFIGITLIEVYRTTHLPQEATAAADSTVGGPLLRYQHAEAPGFHMRVPQSWLVRTLEAGGRGTQPTLIAFDGTDTGNPSQFYVSAVPGQVLHGGTRLLPIVLARLHPGLAARLAGSSGDRGWRSTEFALGPQLTGVAWERPIGRTEWLLLGVAARSAISRNRPLFGFMWRSFSYDAHPVSALAGVHNLAHRRLDPYRYDPVLVVPFLAWLLVVVTVGAALGRLRSRVAPGAALAGVFALAFGVLFLFSELRPVLEELVDGPVGPLYSVRLPGIQAAVAVGTLAVLGVLVARRRLTGERARLVGGLLLLGAGLQLLVWIAQLYEAGSSAGARLSIAQAIVILLALLWELTVSGESITNGHSSALPRATRVLTFCGYIMLVATAVLFFSSLRVRSLGAVLEPQFESEAWPALGIVQLGVPALLCLVAVRLGVFTPPQTPPPQTPPLQTRAPQAPAG